MFAHCQTFEELNDAYEQAVAAVTSNQTFEQALADLAAGRTPAPDDRVPQWNAIKAAKHARWAELRGEPWPSHNTRARSEEIQNAARTLLAAHNIDVREQVVLLPLAKELTKLTGCEISTAKRHIAKAIRRERGVRAEARWGGSRPGAGRPTERGE